LKRADRLALMDGLDQVLAKEDGSPEWLSVRDLSTKDELGPNGEIVMIPRRGKEPVVIDLEKVAGFAACGLTLSQICDYFGVHLNTFDRYRNKFDALDAAVAQGRARGIARVAAKNMELINNGNLIAGIFYLKSVGKWRDQDSPRDANVNQANVKVELYLPNNNR